MKNTIRNNYISTELILWNNFDYSIRIRFLSVAVVVVVNGRPILNKVLEERL